ncbi:MAG: hypothetical protein HC876_18380 [Chloroflexaceae bacterium]|nr:hypothetical protein [Chloroflexaceae bacterium]
MGSLAIVTGYPCVGIPDDDIGKQFTSEGAVLGFENYLLEPERIVTFNADAVGCNSGSPVYTRQLSGGTIVD